MRCQYCGKNLWPLRGLFDEDFCSRDHRQRYHERVRKAMDHMPKPEAVFTASALAEFQLETPRPQEMSPVFHANGTLWQHPAAPALPHLALGSRKASLATGPFSYASPQPAASQARPAEVAAEAFATNVLSIDSLRARLHEGRRTAPAAPMSGAFAGIAPESGNMAPKGSHRWSSMVEVFDELNHVYLLAPDPALEASLPFGASPMIAAPQPASVTARARHTAAAGPAGAGRVEFFPMQPLTGAGMPSAAGDADKTLPEMAGQTGENIWLEDLASWRIPVNMAPTRSALAMLPMIDREAALEQFRNASPAAVTSARPLAWEFAAASAKRRPMNDAGLRLAPAMVIEFPAARNDAAQPLSEEAAYIDQANFSLWLPGMAVEIGEMEISTDTADIAPVYSDAFEQHARTGETAQPHGSGWFPLPTGSVLPTCSGDLPGLLADPKFDSDLLARSVPFQPRNGAESVRADFSISLPDRAVRLKHGPEFFAAEPVVADSVAMPMSARRVPLCIALAMPQSRITEDDETLALPAGVRSLLPGGFAGEAALSTSFEVIDTVSVLMPVMPAVPAALPQGGIEKISVRFRDTDCSLRMSGWMAPVLALVVPEMEYEEIPLALKVEAPEPQTVTVFETATVEQHPKVQPINERRPRQFTVPSYMKGMAAGIMLASFLWFGSSSIKSDGMTLRPGDLIRLTVQRRALHEVGDNFQAGLASWDGGRNSRKTWAYDKEGFIRPGRLALYKPSHDMTDYKMEFLAQIERKSVGWVFRAADEQNYYAMKLAVTEPGPRPLVALERYLVIDGKRESRGGQPLQVMMHNNRPYRVQVDVKGNHFLTSIEGQLVDSWSDDRIKTGGVGFFTEGSEKARLYWMKVTKNSDFLGKLCSILVPKES